MPMLHWELVNLGSSNRFHFCIAATDKYSGHHHLADGGHQESRLHQSASEGRVLPQGEGVQGHLQLCRAKPHPQGQLDVLEGKHGKSNDRLVGKTDLWFLGSKVIFYCQVFFTLIRGKSYETGL